MDTLNVSTLPDEDLIKALKELNLPVSDSRAANEKALSEFVEKEKQNSKGPRISFFFFI